MSFKVIDAGDYKPLKIAKIPLFTDDDEKFPIAKIVDNETGKNKAYILCRSAGPDDLDWFPGIEMEDEGDHIEPMPELSAGRRHAFYVVGQSGTYKSTFARTYADNFLEEFERMGEKPRIIIICMDDPTKDPAFATLPNTWIQPAELVESFANSPEDMTPEAINPDMRPTLFIFDDIEGIGDRITKKIMDAFTEMVLTRGRKYRLHSIYISHAGAKRGGNSSIHLLESSHISIPLKHVIGQNIKYTTEQHFNLPSSLRKVLQSDYMNFGPRALISAGGSPQVILTDKRLISLDQEKIDAALDDIKHKRKLSLEKMRRETRRH